MKYKVSDIIFNSMSIDDRQRSLLGGAVREADLGVTVNRLPPSTLNPVGFSLHEVPFYNMRLYLRCLHRCMPQSLLNSSDIIDRI